jgi:hypothetical protein
MEPVGCRHSGAVSRRHRTGGSRIQDHSNKSNNHSSDEGAANS